MLPKIVAGLAILMVGGFFALGWMGGVQAQGPISTPTAIPDPVMGILDLEAVSLIDLTAPPVIPEISETAVQLYRGVLASGKNPHTFAKVGDCMTHNPYFLVPIGEGSYDLGEYANLQRVVDQYVDGELNSFARESQASAGGFNAASVIDAMWANQAFCESGESPLACEFRIMQPSVALIMFGTNDVLYLTEEQFDFFLRSVIVETLRAGVLPIMSTFPYRPEVPDKVLLYNQIVIQVAQDYDVPLINLWRALDPLPDQGINPEDVTHMSLPPDGAACVFIGDSLQAGFNVRNLVTLQTLDALLQAAEQE